MVDMNMLDMDMVDMDIDMVDMDIMDMDIVDMDMQVLGIGGSSVDHILSFFIIAISKGAEFEVLKHVPWEKVEVEVLMIELAHAGKVTNH